MQTAVLAVALAALSLGAQATPIPVPATIDSSPTYSSPTHREYLGTLNPRTNLVANQDQLFELTSPPPLTGVNFDGSVPPIPGPFKGMVLAVAEPPTFLTFLFLLAITAALQLRRQLEQEKRRKYRRRIRIDLRQLA